MKLNYREPLPDDGRRIHQMVLESGTLDVNSAYLYFLLADHFRKTVVLAESPAGDLGGFVTAYRPPQAPQTLFIWQVAVAAELRGRGIASRLLENLMQRPFFADIQRIELTITPDTLASLRLFARLARDLRRPLQHTPYLSAAQLGGTHAAEDLYCINLTTEIQNEAIKPKENPAT